MFQESYLRSGKVVKPLIFAFAAIGMGVGLFMFLALSNSSHKSKAATGDFVTLGFDPATPRANQNENFVSTIMFSGASRSFSTQGYNLHIVFDKTKLQVQNIEYDFGNQSAGLGQSNSDLQTINSAGEMTLQAEVANATPGVVDPSNPVPLAKVTYQVIAPDLTTSDVNVTGTFVEVKQDFSLNLIPVTATSFTVANPSVTLTPTTPVSVTPKISCVPPPMCAFDSPACAPTPGIDWCPVTGNTKINMKLKFQGITAQPRVTTPLNVHIIMTDSNSTKVADQLVGFTSDANGIWSGVMGIDFQNTTDNAARYTLYIKGPKHLQKRVCENTPTESAPGTYSCLQGNVQVVPGTTNTVDMSGIYQMVGDLPVDNGQQNGVVDSSDTSYIRLHFGDTSAAALQTADLNMDGIVDTQDFSLVIAALNVKYDDPIK